MNKRYKTLIIILFLIIIGLFIFRIINFKEYIVIYSCMEDYRNEAMQELLNKKFPNLNIYIQPVSTGNCAAKIKLEKERVEADIFLDLEECYANELSNNFYSLNEFKTLDYLDEFKFDNDSYKTFAINEVGIIVNKDLIEEKKLSIPTSYDDLLKDEFRDLIVMSNPKTSGTGYMILNNIINIMGKEEGFKYFDKLEKNIREFTVSGSGPIKLLKEKEATIALGMISQAVIEINNGANFEIYPLISGTPYNILTCGIIKGKENDNVKEVFQYILTDGIKNDKNYMPGKIFYGQDTKVDNYPDNLEKGNMMGINDSNLRVNILKEWKY